MWGTAGGKKKGMRVAEKGNAVVVIVRVVRL